MTRPELLVWASNPPSKSPQAMTVAGAVLVLVAEVERLEEWQKDRADEFVPLATANADLETYKRHNAELQAELARLRKLVLPAAEWELTEPEWMI